MAQLVKPTCPEPVSENGSLRPSQFTRKGRHTDPIVARNNVPSVGRIDFPRPIRSSLQNPCNRVADHSFRRVRTRLFLRLQKAKAGNLEWRPKPAGLELGSDSAERRNYPEAKPKREGRKGRPACKARVSRVDVKGTTACPPSTEIMPHPP